MSKTRIVFVHGMDGYGAAAWPAQHLLAGTYDCLFLKRTGFDAVEPPVATDFAADAASIVAALGRGGHVVAHAQGAPAAMMAAVERPDLVASLVLIEPMLASLTAELPATAAYSQRVEELYARAPELDDAAFLREFNTLLAIPAGGSPESEARRAARARLQRATTEAPLHIIPGVPTMVLTGGWEPLYEEVAGFLASTGAHHAALRSGPRPQDSPEGAEIIEAFIDNSAQGG
ncbi:pimeloyl-ACP methyl ester carboxylesterase [Arthrobacter stackebrandtii]|uniref:Pimeloyl-ACP methyl ester carboxylesterase n=1 Tax=Arthrobacter stackebrandtii TaxID=272161 RepID=A0ABS4YZ94_9MICC|nr:alpha/beta fold hydrolase [Arthrobacter stackebrandtii]MBP2414115.1 pimeloyl-ACP methyl ester carboxylesterase [Arthrobacter stackebrandtii]PYG99344.1 hypothetical protein CVV67_15615 [Arthrobacter stackebrandtii]